MTQSVLLLPGLLCDQAVWQPQCEGLAEHICVVPDYGMADSIVEMAQVALSSAPTPVFALAGHSMGGRVALEIARQAPERVSRLALLDTGVHALAAGAAGEEEVAGRMALVHQAQSHGMRAMGEIWARGMVHPDRLDTPVFEEILAMIARKTAEIFACQQRALINRPEASDVLAGLSCPVWLGCGRQDAWSTLARHEAMLSLRPGAVLRVIEDSGHMTTMERPESVTAMLRGWLAA